jgi:hypothetical protein
MTIDREYFRKRIAAGCSIDNRVIYVELTMLNKLLDELDAKDEQIERLKKQGNGRIGALLLVFFIGWVLFFFLGWEVGGV